MDHNISLENDIFRHIPLEQHIAIQRCFKYKTYKKAAFIIQPNDLVKDLYWIQSGLVKLSYEDENCREHILSFAFEDWWETDFSAFYHQTRSKLYLQCLEPTALYALSYADYQCIVQQYSLSNYFLQKSINGHIANQHRILSLLTDSPKSRYELFISSYPALVQRISKTVLAQYLGVSRETLSRIYK